MSSHDGYRDYDPIQPRGTDWRGLARKIFGPVVAVIVALAKFSFLLVKFGSIFIAVGGYALIWGWKFAVGFVLLILVHEAGHYVEAKRQGLNPSLPVFLPFLGAYVAMKNAPFDPWRNLLVSAAGPVAGGLGALGVWIAGETTDSRFLVALAYSGFMLNLLNLIPVRPFDGGFMWRSVRALRAGNREHVPWSSPLRVVLGGTIYGGLVLALVFGMVATHLPQDRL